jgi:uncharacterized protein
MSNPSSNDNTHNVGHFEIPADDADRLRNFYSSLFGWQFEKARITPGYWMIKNAGISGGLMKKEHPEQMPSMYISVESIDEYINKAQELGAKIVKNKQEVDDGFYAVMEDPQGNTFGIWQGK